MVGNRQKQIADLESRSKQLYELVVTEKFTVLDVIAKSIPYYNGGLTSRLVLEVLPDNPDVPVRTLTFEGISVVRAGDSISAKIPRYEEKEVGRLDYRVGEILYLDRAFKPQECAIELAILSNDGNLLRRDRAVDYNRFVKE